MAKKVLVVDDEPAFTDLVAQALAFQKIEVVQANSGQAALEALAKDAFDLMTLDLNMPEMNGIQVAKAVNQKYPNLKIVVITGFGSDYDDELPRCKIVKVLPKPLPFDQLFAAMKEILG